MPTETIYPTPAEHHTPESPHMAAPQPQVDAPLTPSHLNSPAVEPVLPPAEPTPAFNTSSDHFFGASMPPPPEAPAASLSGNGSDKPVAVVQALSVRGVEYTMMTLCLWFAAASFIWLLLSLLNGGGSYTTLTFPVSVLIVSVPVFGFLFLRLRRDELANPELRLDPSKRRLSQFTQIFAFAACFFNVIGLIYEIMQKLGGHFSGSLGKIFIDVLIVFVVAGGVLAYYWIDEHRLVRQK
jgi:hypothetical protein